jgi:DNA-binding ferritin-like protein
MQNLLDRALDTYITLLVLHINTKTKDPIFHKESESFYKEVFEMFHSIWERSVDLWLAIDTNNDYSETAFAKLKLLLESVESTIRDWSLTVWTESLLTDIASKLESLIWTSKSLLKTNDSK